MHVVWQVFPVNGTQSVAGGWVFRVASTPEVGGGHLARCLTLAKELKRLQPVHFVLDPGGESWAERIEAEGMGISYSGQMLPDLASFRGVLMDGYSFSEAQRKEWKGRCGVLAQIDDLGTASEQADLIIAPSLHVVPHHLIGDSRLLSGARYALLDPCYAGLREPEGEVDSVLLAFGLRDSHNLSSLALQALEQTGFKGKVAIAIGSGAPHLAALRNAVSMGRVEVELYVDTRAMCELMSSVQLVMGAGGVSLFERMAAGRPSLSVIVADNQRNQVEWAVEQGATQNLGIASGLTVEMMMNQLQALLQDCSRRGEMARMGRGAVDGGGGRRVAAVMSEYSV